MNDLDTELNKITLGEVLKCKIIWKDDTDDCTVYDDYRIAVSAPNETIASDDNIGFYCNSIDEFRELLNPNNKDSELVVVAFEGESANYDCWRVVRYISSSWTLHISGYTTGGYWYYIATDGVNVINSGNVWSFRDSCGQANDYPTPDMESLEVLIDALDTMCDNDVPSLTEWTRLSEVLNEQETYHL